jgi:hypothetical protein
VAELDGEPNRLRVLADCSYRIGFPCNPDLDYSLRAMARGGGVVASMMDDAEAERARLDIWTSNISDRTCSTFKTANTASSNPSPQSAILPQSTLCLYLCEYCT